MELTSEQMAAIRMFHSPRPSRSYFVITGGPGSGKTTLIKHLRSGFAGIKHLIAAPTGLAAERIKQATGYDARVISKVDFSASLREEFRGCILIIDEASMVSIDLAAILLRVLEPIKLVVIGDEHQLPCIGTHSLLSTMLAAKECVHVVRLTQNLRQRTAGGSNALITAITNIGRGNEAWSSAMPQDDTFRVFSFNTTEQAIQAAAAEFKRRQGEAQMFGNTNAVVQKLNAMTAGEANVPRRVVCCRNMPKKGSDDLLNVANGTRGICDPDGVVHYDNGYVDKRRVTVHEDARCLTVHKGQGSEFDEHGIVQVSWFKDGIPAENTYTAISRFRSSVSIYGSKRDLEIAFSTKFVPASFDKDVVAMLTAATQAEVNVSGVS